MENMNADKISESIRACRKRQGLSQDELANRLHVTRQAVSKWENGSALPSVDMLIALANVFQLSVDELLGVSPKQESEPTLRPETVGALLDEHTRRQDKRTAHMIWVLIVVAVLLAAGIGLIAWRSEQHSADLQQRMNDLEGNFSYMSASLTSEVQNAVQDALNEGTSILTDGGVRSLRYDYDANAFVMELYAYPREGAGASATFSADFNDGRHLTAEADYQTGAGYHATLTVPAFDAQHRPLLDAYFTLYITLHGNTGDQAQRIGTESLSLYMYVPQVFDSHTWSYSSLSGKATFTPAVQISEPEGMDITEIRAFLYDAKGKLLAQSELFAEPQGETYAVTWRGKSLELDGSLSESHRMRYRVTDGAGHVFFYEGDASDGSIQLMEDPPQE